MCTTLTPSAESSLESGSIVVSVRWRGADVDRPVSGAWSVPDTARGRVLAARLTRAINAGAATGPGEVRRDVNGATYVSAGHNVLGRRMGADLRRLGF